MYICLYMFMYLSTYLPAATPTDIVLAACHGLWPGPGARGQAGHFPCSAETQAVSPGEIHVFLFCFSLGLWVDLRFRSGMRE